MRKRFIVQRIVTVTKDWLGRPQEPVETVTWLCKEHHIEIIQDKDYNRKAVDKVWTNREKEIRYFPKEEKAERAAFAVVLQNAGVYVGEVSVVKVPSGKDLIKVRRRSPEKVNVGRWPHSSGRRRKS